MNVYHEKAFALVYFSAVTGLLFIADQRNVLWRKQKDTCYEKEN
jgi:hypothetical protein